MNKHPHAHNIANNGFKGMRGDTEKQHSVLIQMIYHEKRILRLLIRQRDSTMI
jgi:hypothetical protein